MSTESNVSIKIRSTNQTVGSISRDFINKAYREARKDWRLSARSLIFAGIYVSQKLFKAIVFSPILLFYMLVLFSIAEQHLARDIFDSTLKNTDAFQQNLGALYFFWELSTCVLFTFFVFCDPFTMKHPLDDRVNQKIAERLGMNPFTELSFDRTRAFFSHPQLSWLRW